MLQQGTYALPYPYIVNQAITELDWYITYWNYKFSQPPSFSFFSKILMWMYISKSLIWCNIKGIAKFKKTHLSLQNIHLSPCLLRSIFTDRWNKTHLLKSIIGFNPYIATEFLKNSLKSDEFSKNKTLHNETNTRKWLNWSWM